MDERALLQVGYRYALSLTHRREDAEDLVQDAWLKLGRKGRPVDRGLLMAAVRSLFIDRYRRHRLAVFEPFDEERLPPVELGRQADGADLETALGQLRPEEREALFLHSVEGYTAQQIARFTGRPRGTVLSLIHRGKQKAAHILRRIWDDDRRSCG